MTDRPRVEVHLEPVSAGGTRVTIGGVDVTAGIRREGFHVEVDDVGPVAIMHLRVDELSASGGRAVVHRATRELLEQLGWTAPPKPIDYDDPQDEYRQARSHD